MTNYEKHKEEIIDMITRASNCIKLLRLCGHEGECGKYACLDCQNKLTQWLNEEAKELDPYKLKEGDKIVMRKNGNYYSREYEVLGNSLSVLWLRDNDNKEDSGFLISHKDMLEHYVIEEVFQ